MIEIDLGPDPLEPESLCRRSSALGLVVFDDQHAFRGPAPLDGAFAQAALNLCRFFVVCYLERAGLSNVDHGQAVEMTSLDLGGPGPMVAANGHGDRGSRSFLGERSGWSISGLHERPPFPWRRFW